MLRRIIHIVGLLVLLTGVSACFKDSNFEFKAGGDGSGAAVMPSREQSPDVRNVLLYVVAGFNSLSEYLAEDIADLESGSLPGRESPTEPVLLVFSRLPETPGSSDYSQPSSPVLFRLYAKDGRPVRDTLKVWSPDTRMSNPETLTEALNFTNSAFPGNRYGVIFSSHASGWLPPRYYENPAPFETGDVTAFGKRSSQSRILREVFPPIGQDNYPAVKSIGMDNDSPVTEMDLDAFAAAIPYHLDYLLFDACLMGCVEVAYELKDKADVVGFSQTEVLADGFNYSTLSTHLLVNNPDPVAVCRDYFEFYNKQTGDNRSATISVVNTQKLDKLAQVCSVLFEKYRIQLANMPGSRVQGYFRFNRHFFYDLRDILLQAGITEEEDARLQAALEQCIMYKAATPSFLGISINSYSGFSMYLPSEGSSHLDNYYRNHVAWNKATGLVK